MKIFFRLIFAKTWDSREYGFALISRFCQDQKKGANESKIPKQELNIPQDAIGDSLKVESNGQFEENCKGFSLEFVRFTNVDQIYSVL